MFKFIIATALGAVAIGGASYAAQQVMQPGEPRPMRGDTNGDGVVTRAEFLADAGQRFDRMDANKDGKIDAAERQAMRGKMGHRGERGEGMGRHHKDGDRTAPQPAPTNR